MKRVTIGFRLAESDQERLEATALRDGVSPHELAKEYTLKGLRGVKAETRTQPQASESELQKLREDLALALETLLIVTKVFSPEEAHSFVDEKFHR